MFRSAAMDAESPTAEHYRKAAKEIRQVTHRSRFRGIDDELFDLDERCDRMALVHQGDGIDGHVGLTQHFNRNFLV